MFKDFSSGVAENMLVEWLRQHGTNVTSDNFGAVHIEDTYCDIFVARLKRYFRVHSNGKIEKFGRNRPATTKGKGETMELLFFGMLGAASGFVTALPVPFRVMWTIVMHIGGAYWYCYSAKIPDFINKIIVGSNNPVIRTIVHIFNMAFTGGVHIGLGVLMIAGASPIRDVEGGIWMIVFGLAQLLGHAIWRWGTRHVQ